MKYLLLIFITFSLFGSDLQQQYKQLNEEIDSVTAQLTPEEKVKLYYLVLATHDKITSALSVDETKMQSLEEIRLKTMQQLSQLESKLGKKKVATIKKLYISLHENGEKLIAEKNLILPKLFTKTRSYTKIKSLKKPLGFSVLF